jgi:hypothetical protein
LMANSVWIVVLFLATASIGAIFTSVSPDVSTREPPFSLFLFFLLPLLLLLFPFFPSIFPLPSLPPFFLSFVSKNLPSYRRALPMPMWKSMALKKAGPVWCAVLVPFIVAARLEPLHSGSEYFFP